MRFPIAEVKSVGLGRSYREGKHERRRTIGMEMIGVGGGACKGYRGYKGDRGYG